MTSRAGAIVAVLLVAAIGIGWVWGASGKAAVERDRIRISQQMHFEKGRALVLEGRLTLVGNDYARAAASFGAAVTELEALQLSLRELSLAEIAGRVEIAVAQIKAARDQAGAQTANAWSSADAALQALKGISLPE